MTAYAVSPSPNWGPVPPRVRGLTGEPREGLRLVRGRSVGSLT